jgi:hypothetical protein
MKLTEAEERELAEYNELLDLLDQPGVKKFIDRFIALRIQPALEELQTTINNSASWDRFNRFRGRREGVQSVQVDISGGIEAARDSLGRKLQQPDVPDPKGPATGELR